MPTKRLLVVVAVLLALVFSPAPAFAHSCSCNAPDGSCSASVSCPGGCYAICGTGGACGSGCSGGGGSGWNPESQGLTRPPKGGPPKDPATITLSARDMTSTDLATVLGTHLNTAVTFVPANPAETYSVDINNMPAEEFLTALAEFGAISTADGTPKKNEELSSAKVTLQVRDSTAGEVVAMLNQLMGRSGSKLKAGNPDEELSLDVQQMNLGTLVEGLAATTSIRVVPKEP